MIGSRLLVASTVFGLLFGRALALSLVHGRDQSFFSSRSRLNSSCQDSNRRAFLLSGVAVPLCVTCGPRVAQCSEVRGPVELLRPATRLKLYLNRAISICEDSKSSNGSLYRLADYLMTEEPMFITPEEEQLARRYMEIDTSTAWEAARLKEREARGAEMGIDYATPYDKLNTAVQQFGDRRTFQRLRKRQQGLEKQNTMRAAFNAYTNNLVFGDAYQLNVQGDAKKALVRNDALPNVNSVVVSDLDLRDLYRNQVLQNMEDAKAEVEYQKRTGEWDVDEILQYLIQAQIACDEWFKFIPENDVKEALLAVQHEKENQSQ